MVNNLGLVDSNLLIYSFDYQSPFFKKAFRFIKELAENNKLIIPYPVILESYRILTEKIKKPLLPKKFWQALDYYLEFTEVCFPTSKTLKLIKDLSEKYNIKGVEIFDLQIVALSLENNLKIIYTHNQKDFLRFKEIKVVDPLS